MPPTGERFTLEFAERLQGGGPCYVASHLGDFETNHAIRDGRFWLRLRLRGTNCQQEFWIKIDSKGTSRPECSLA
jgi:hypothetical protein